MIWLFDNGHNGMVGAKYLTKGKQSPAVIPGLGIYEGEFNRDIVKRVVGGLLLAGYDAADLVPESSGMSLKDRCLRANTFTKYDRLISIHANAQGKGKEWTSANGLTIFHYPGSTKGRALAQIAHGQLTSYLDFHDRGIKAAKFAMLRKTRMPAILVEHGFMTNKGDAKRLASDAFRDRIANAYIDMVAQIEESS